MKKRIISIWIIAAIIIGVALFFFFRGKTQVKTVQYKTAKVERGDVVLMVSATGTLDAVTSVDVGSQVSGIIKKIYVDFNSNVKKGQLIAQIDPVSYKAKLDQADASLTKAKIAVVDAKRTLDRNVELLSQNFIAQSEKDAAQTAYENAIAGLKQTKASYDLSLADYRNCTIYSPISGIVISRNINEGQTVAASFSAPTLFVIAKDLKQMQVEASVDEGDIGKIEVGQEVDFTVDAFPDKKFFGRVSQIRLSPVIVSKVVTYSVMINVFNEKLLLKPGMTATVNIIAAKANNTLKVLNAALKFQPVVNGFSSKNGKNGNKVNSDIIQKTAAAETMPLKKRKDAADKNIIPAEQQAMGVVWVKDEKGLRPVKVKLGITDNVFTEIRSSELQENQEVITGIGTQTKKTAAATSAPFGMQGPGGSRR